MKRLEGVANIAVIVAAFVFVAVVVRSEFTKRGTAPPSDLIGRRIELPGIQFPKSNKSLVIVVSTVCHFCKESLPFYRDLSIQLRGKMDVIAVLPEPQPEAQAFIREADISAAQTVSASLNSIGVSGTPTLLLLDKDGTVERVWLGKLDAKRRQEVLSVVSQ